MVNDNGVIQPPCNTKQTNKCYTLESGKWSEVIQLPELGRYLHGLPILKSQWIMFSGGLVTENEEVKSTPSVFLLNGKGRVVDLKPLTKARWSHCTAVLYSNQSSTVVGFLGGNIEGSGTSRSMESKGGASSAKFEVDHFNKRQQLRILKFNPLVQ